MTDKFVRRGGHLEPGEADIWNPPRPPLSLTAMLLSLPCRDLV